MHLFLFMCIYINWPHHYDRLNKLQSTCMTLSVEIDRALNWIREHLRIIIFS